MKCCIKCFNDEYLKDKIKRDGSISDCDYCRGSAEYTIDTSELVNEFEVFFSLYEPTIHGEHFSYELDHCPTEYGYFLEDLIQNDWNVFSDNTKPKSLLFEVLNTKRKPEDSLDSHQLYSKHSSAYTYVSNRDSWNDFAYTLKRKNRYFPKPDFSIELKTLIPNKSATYCKGHKFYRARIGKHKIKMMGPPPFKLATPGRVNPKGIPYLYVASNELTSIAETRPWVGSDLTIATLYTTKPLKIIDLSSKEFLDSPFRANNLAHSIEANQLLNQFSYELSKPVHSDDSYLEYIPTQYLAELIKTLDYDGISCQSSLGDDKNFVFFNPDDFIFTEVQVKQIKYVGYQYN